MTVVLNMTVGNEAHVIRRCLKSVRPWIDSYCIHCNGTDETAAIVREELAGLPGTAVENTWVNQEHNRNLALEDARPRADYVLLIDADEFLEARPGFTMPVLDADCYELAVRYKSLEFARPMLLRSALPWRWVGARHPCLKAEGGKPPVRLEGLVNLVTSSGASWSDPEKWNKAVEDMRAQVAADPSNARAHYYLAQSLRDAGRLEEAAAAYQVRTAMTGWVEETWSAHLERAKLLERLGRPHEEVAGAYLMAHAHRPTRAEGLYHLARFIWRRRGPTAALAIARAATTIPRPPDRLFVEWQIYETAAAQQVQTIEERLANKRAAHAKTKAPEATT